ncbi:hypothetical protein [Aurantimonas sp. 22II-16-19i]|uniref:hypothetical protein n=1 Tax=Aurantimonas sp. 22II-16-19i TaxID=1317114 RepID=UPI0009F7ABD2|nr:hypothetical protein [Aurantimonas sp. 22II-16-19i]ORE91402.1 hypothetical protein ATO4_18769 [Aurantimonas sp. 22II-16-19i]
MIRKIVLPGVTIVVASSVTDERPSREEDDVFDVFGVEMDRTLWMAEGAVSSAPVASDARRQRTFVDR